METNDILLLIAGVVLGLISNYIVNYTSTPLANRFKEWQIRRAQKRAKESVAKAKIRISKLQKELDQIVLLETNPTEVSLRAYARIIYLIQLLFPFIAFTLVAQITLGMNTIAKQPVDPTVLRLIITGIAIIIIMIYLISQIYAIQLMNTIDNLLKSGEYKSRLESQILELQEFVARGNL